MGLIQSKISKIVARAPLAFVQEEDENHEDGHEKEYYDCPPVNGKRKKLEVGESSPLSIPSDTLINPNLDSDDDYSHSITQEKDDYSTSTSTIVDNEELESQQELFNEDENTDKDPNRRAKDIMNEKQVTNNRSEEDVNACHGNQGQDSKCDPGYDPDLDSEDDDHAVAAGNKNSLSKSKTNSYLELPTQNDDLSDDSTNDTEINISQFAIHPDDLDPDLHVGVNLIKQEPEEFIYELMDMDYEFEFQDQLNEDENMNETIDLPAADTQKKMEMNECQSLTENVESSSEEDKHIGQLGFLPKDCDSDSEYEPPKYIKSAYTTNPRGQHSIKKDPKVGENIYEYGGKWRYERKLEEDGKFKLYCLSCSPRYSNVHRYRIIEHIKSRHIKAERNSQLRIQRRLLKEKENLGDDNNAKLRTETKYSSEDDNEDAKEENKLPSPHQRRAKRKVKDDNINEEPVTKTKKREYKTGGDQSKPAEIKNLRSRTRENRERGQVES